MIVLDATSVPFRDRSAIYEPVGTTIPMDVTVCTRAELERELAAGNRFVRRIADESVILYARAAAPAPGRYFASIRSG